MSIRLHPNLGIEIEFAMDIELLKAKLEANNVEYLFVENRRTEESLAAAGSDSLIRSTSGRRRTEPQQRVRSSSTTRLVVKPDKSVGLLDGWELNFPPSYTWEDIEFILELLKECNPTFPEKAALHIHVDVYSLSQLNIDQVHSYYYNNQNLIIDEAKAVNMYVNLNEPLPKTPEEVTTRKTNLNIKHAVRRHNTIEHRIYKSTMDINEIKWCVDHTLSIFNRALSDIEFY